MISRQSRGDSYHISSTLPFEIWQKILHIVYSFETEISHPPSPFELSPLNSRLHIYRCLALVSRTWRANAQDVFFEVLQAETHESLHGILSALQSMPHLGNAVRKLSLSFYEFRCSSSTPRRPRKLRPSDNTNDDAEMNPEVTTRDLAAMRRTQRHAYYQPSVTMQASHWNRWHAKCSDLLHLCPNISEIFISFTSNQYYSGAKRSGSAYQTLFPAPNLGNEGVLHGLLGLSNLRRLYLVDPSPLAEYGPSLATWERLHTLSITLTNSYKELSDTAFIPPRSLVSFTFHDKSNGEYGWPLSSDLARCTNLLYLDLGVARLQHPNTTVALSFLLQAYQSTLTHLTLTSLGHHRPRRPQPNPFEPVLSSEEPLHFERLRSLRFIDGSCKPTLFGGIRADVLEKVEVGGFYFDTTQDKRAWRRALSATSLKGLKQLTVLSMEQEPADLLREVATEMDISIQIDQIL